MVITHINTMKTTKWKKQKKKMPILREGKGIVIFSAQQAISVKR